MTHPRAPMREGTPLRERMSQAEFDAHCAALIQKHWAKQGKDVVVVPTPDGLQSNIVGGEPLPVTRKAGKVYVQKPQQLGATAMQEQMPPPHFVADTRFRMVAPTHVKRRPVPDETLADFRAKAIAGLAAHGLTLDEVKGTWMPMRQARVRHLVMVDILDEMRVPAWVVGEIFECGETLVFAARNIVRRYRKQWGDGFSVERYLNRPCGRTYDKAAPAQQEAA